MVMFSNRAGLNLYFKRYGRVRVEGDLFSMALSAIQSFLREAVGAGVTEIRAEGDLTFHIKEEGEVIVCVLTVYSLPKSDIDALVSELLGGFLSRYRETLESWNGNTAEFEDADEVVEPVVQKFEQKFDEARKRCAMILTLGTSTEPLIKTVKNFRPDYVCFLSTKDMLMHLSEVLDKTGARDKLYEYNYYQIGKKEDFSHCLNVSEQAFDELFRRGFSAKDILSDITGGTKVMSVGLGMAAVKYYSNMLYVGGERRDEQGRVLSGSEVIYQTYNPYEFFASKQIERGLELFNGHRWRTAMEVFDEAQRNLGGGKKKELASIFRDLARAYGLWDRFHYGVAVRSLENVRNALQEFCRFSPSNALEELRSSIDINLGALSVLDSMEKIGGLTYPAVVDMFSNALRRSREAEFDDAAARVYRLIEMLAQYKLEKYGIKTSDVDLDKIKSYDGKLADALSLMKDESGKIRLGLRGSYIVLNSLDGDPGKSDLRNKLLDCVQQMRNQSILAHGLTPTFETSFEQLKKLTESLLKEEIPDFEKTMKELQFPRLQEELKTYLRETSE
nr:TIGR02710 family CRISPR-associated CARF protein [Candidatus Freyarchaeota archaeon]